MDRRNPPSRMWRPLLFLWLVLGLPVGPPRWFPWGVPWEFPWEGGQGAPGLAALEPPLVWKVAVGGAASAPPAVGPGGTIYLAAEDRMVHAVSASGNKLWACPLPGPAPQLLMAGGDGSVYGIADPGRIYRISSRGTLLWTRRAEGFLPGAAALGPRGALAWAGLREGQGFLSRFRENGETAWERRIEGTPAGVWILQEGVIALGTEGGLLCFFAPWGEELSRFRLTGGAAHLAVDSGGTVYAAADTGHLTALDRGAVWALGEGEKEGDTSGDNSSGVGRIQGVSGGRAGWQPGVLWSRQTVGEGEAAWGSYILEEKGILLGLSGRGGLKRWTAGGRSLGGQQLPVRRSFDGPGLMDRGRTWYAVRAAGLSAWERGERLWTLDNREGWAGMALEDGPEGGRLYAAGKDWILYCLRASGPALTGWNQSRATSRQDNAVRQGLDLMRRKSLFAGRPEFQILRGRSRSLDPERRHQVLRLLEKSLEGDSLRKDYPYADILLIELCRDGSLKPVYREGSVVNRFPRVQARALDILARGRYFSARPVMLQLADQAQDGYVARAAVEALGRLGSDPDGAALDIMQDRMNRNPGNPGWATSVLNALEALTGEVSSLRPGEQALISRIALGDYPLVIRQRAMALLESRT